MLAQAYHRHSRFLAALVFGGLMWAASRALPVDPVMSGLIAINSFFLGYLALIMTMILRSTPEKMRRKGSFLTRFFTNPSGPMVNEKGEPTRLALSANAWGEPVPKNMEDAKALAAKGRRLLERYENTKNG